MARLFSSHSASSCCARLAACAAALLVAGAVLAEGIVKGALEVRGAWARATPPAAPVAAGYLEVRNAGKQADRLTGASTPVAERVEIHVMAREGDIMRMREVPGLEVPAGAALRLQPGGAHLMLVAPRKPLVAGGRVPLILRFERAGEIAVELEVRAMGAHGHGH